MLHFFATMGNLQLNVYVSTLKYRFRTGYMVLRVAL